MTKEPQESLDSTKKDSKWMARDSFVGKEKCRPKNDYGYTRLLLKNFNFTGRSKQVYASMQ